MLGVLQDEDMNKRVPLVLIVENDNYFRVELEHELETNGLKIISAKNGKSALELVKNTERICVYLIEPELPDINNYELINAIKKKDEHAAIVVYTRLTDPGYIIKTMKKGVLDFFLKSEKKETVVNAVLKAIELKRDIYEEQVIAKNILSHIHEEFTWMTYKLDKINNNQEDGISKESIRDLKNSLVQGQGIGSGISLVKLLDDTKEEFDERSYLVNKDIFQVAVENNTKSEMVFNAINQLEKLFREPVDKAVIPVNWIVRELFEFIELFQGIFGDKQFSIRMSSADFKKSVYLDIDKMLLSVEELLLNAYKYSLPGSDIDVLLSVYEGYFSVSVRNNISSLYSIPKDQEHEILKPFRRLGPAVEDKIPVEKFTVGLGLTAVDYITRLHEGIFTVREVLDTLSETGKSVIAEMLYPLKSAVIEKPLSSIAV